jgi:cell division protein FtsI (penicillin-binding protein 3)
MRRRTLGILAVACVALLGLVGRMVYIQIIAYRRYDRYATAQDVRSTVLPTLRGSLLDRDGQTLAMSELRYAIIADPHQIADPAQEATTLAPMVHVAESSLAHQLAQDAGYVVVAPDVSHRTDAAIMKLNLAGITDQTSPTRSYPDGQLAAPVLGMVNATGQGAAGLEYAFNHDLAGTAGKLVQQVDPQGRALAGGTISYKPPALGNDLVLTIDQALQYQTEQALGQALVAAKAKRGVAMVMNTHTGGLLAVADLTIPAAGTHDTPALPVTLGTNGKILPSGTKTSVVQPVESPSADAFTQVYEPGSVEKLVTVSAALATGVVTPDQSFTVPNAYPVDGVAIHDDENHGTERLTTTGIVAQSSNIGATQIVQRLGAPTLYHYLAAYGLGAVTPVHFPGESPGLVPAEANLSPVTLATISYGEGIGVTAAQMLAAYNTIANGGVYVPPHLVDGIIGANGHEQPLTRPAPHRVVSPTVAKQMTAILEQVVSAGTGSAAKVAPYAVAGKTGTAQYRGPQGYVRGYTDASFAGFAPAQDPAVTVMVVIDDTRDYGAQASAPAFAAITRAALTDLRIPADGPQPAAQPTASPQPVAG